MKKTTKNWLRLADKDLKSAEMLMKNNYVANVTAFLLHQCSEKTLKAVLEENEIEIPRVHDLKKLFKLAEKFVKFSIDEEILLLLNQVYIDSGYPFEIGLLPNGVESNQEIEIFYNFSCDLNNQINSQI